MPDSPGDVTAAEVTAPGLTAADLPGAGPTFRRASIRSFVVLDGGMLVLTVLVLSRAAYDRASTRVPLPPRRLLFWTLIGALVTHCLEATRAAGNARRHDLPARPWVLQTLAVGSPSLGALRKLVAQREG